MGEEKSPADTEPENDVPEVHYEPLVTLPAVETKTLEEEEEELIKLRAKLYRYDGQADEPEWKERGTGDIKILRHKENNTCRVLMRRDKTLKICANHFVYPRLTLTHNCGNEKTWIWATPTDFADEEAKSEMLAVRFSTVEYAQKFKEKMEDARKIMEEKAKKQSTAKSEDVAATADAKAEEEGDDVTKAMGSLSVKEGETPSTTAPEAEESVKAEEPSSNKPQDADDGV